MAQFSTRSAKKPAFRAGSQALLLLASPLNVEILRHLESGPVSTRDLRVELGVPPQSTIRLHLRTLSDFSLIERVSAEEFPTTAVYEITRAGQALLQVGDAVQAWLQVAPAGPKELGSNAAKNTLKALVEGWSSHLIRILAARSLSLTELNSLIPRVSYPSLERRLATMRECDLVEAHTNAGRLRPYEVTDWLRQSVGPLCTAIAWERTYALTKSARLGRLDVEAAFLLAVPLLRLSRKLSGRCRLAVEVHDGTSPVFAGVLVSVEKGEVIACVASLEGEADAWASAKPSAWLPSMTDTPGEGIELGGDRDLVQPLLEAIQRTLREPG